MILHRCNARVWMCLLPAWIVLASVAAAQTPADDFNPGANVSVDAIAVQPDGAIIVGGGFTQIGGGGIGTIERNRIARLDANGSVDPGFNPNATGIVRALAVLPDGKIMMAGSFQHVAGSFRGGLVRLLPDGSLDTTFQVGTANVNALAVQPDGKVLVGGCFLAFGGAGTGTIPKRSLARLNADGSIDNSFDPGANACVDGIAVQPDGRIVVVGAFSTLGGGGSGNTARFGIGRLNADGSVDPTFNPGADQRVLGVAVQSDGRIVIVGMFERLGGGTATTFRSRIGRLLTSGEVDPTFDPGANSRVNTVLIQPDGRIVVGGSFTRLGGGGFPSVGDPDRSHIGRLLPDGSVDLSFDPGAEDAVNALALQPDGRLLIGGEFTRLGGGSTGVTTRHRLGRVDASSDPAPTSFVISASAGPNGTITPAGALEVVAGSIVGFTLAPSAGFAVEAVSGTCGGTLNGLTYTTEPIVNDCTVHAAFAGLSSPRNLAATVARNRVSLTWDSPASAAGVLGYIVEAGAAPGTTTVSVPVGDVTHFATEAPDGIYYVRVRAVTAAGAGLPSGDVRVETGQAAPPRALGGLLATVQGTTVTLQWREDPLGPVIAGTLLQAGSAPGLADLAAIALPAGVHTFTAKAPPGTYFVRVLGVNAAGASAPSAELALTLGEGICTVPDSPTGLSATTTPGGVTLTWDAASTGAIPTGYRLEAGTGPGGSNVGVFTLPAGTSLQAGAPAGTYHVRIAATNACGGSSVSSEISFAVP
jgi:uncharacterized delta-60 repeat protein